MLSFKGATADASQASAAGKSGRKKSRKVALTSRKRATKMTPPFWAALHSLKRCPDGQCLQ